MRFVCLILISVNPFNLYHFLDLLFIVHLCHFIRVISLVSFVHIISLKNKFNVSFSHYSPSLLRIHQPYTVIMQLYRHHHKRIHRPSHLIITAIILISMLCLAASALSCFLLSLIAPSHPMQPASPLLFPAFYYL